MVRVQVVALIGAVAIALLVARCLTPRERIFVPLRAMEVLYDYAMVR